MTAFVRAEEPPGTSSAELDALILDVLATQRAYRDARTALRSTG